MKKTFFSVVAVLAVLALSAPSIYAFGPGQGYAKGYHAKGVAGPGYMGRPALTEEQRSKLTEIHKKFYDETADLRRDVRQKRLELAAIMAGSEPDEAAAVAKMKELSAAREKLAEKQIQFRIKNRKEIEELGCFGPGFGGPRGFDRGHRFGPGMSGKMGSGHGPGQGLLGLCR